MNVIDALVVSFGLDTKEFAKGSKDIDAGLKNLREKSTKYAKETEEQNKRAAESFSSIRTEVLGLLAAVAGAIGFKDLIFGSINSGAALGRLALNLSMSTQRLDAWDTAARDVGETADGVASSMQNIASGLAKVATGDVSYLTAGRQYGLSLDAKGTPEQAALAIAAKMQQFNAEGHRQWAIGLAQAMQVGGMTQTLLSKGLSQNLNTYESRSGATPQFVAQQAALQKSLAETQQRLDAIKDRILVKLGPILEKLATQLANFLDTTNWDKVIAKAQVWFGYVGQVVDALGGVKGILIEIAAYKALVLFGNVATSLVRIGMLTRALFGLKAAATAATVAEGTAGAGKAALAGTAASLAAIAVAAAAAAGALAGYEIYERWLAGTPAGDRLGRLVAGMAASLGLPGAQEAIDRTEGRGPVNHTGDFHPERIGGLRSSRPDDNINLFGPNTANAAGPSTAQILAQPGGATRGIRNNNPGNITYGSFAQGLGATGADDKGFAIFPTAKAGIDAIAANLRSYGRKGINTAYGIAHRWSATDQDVYTQKLAAVFGGGANAPLNMSDPSVIAALTNAIIMQENGRNPYAGGLASNTSPARQIYLDHLRGGQRAGASTVNHSTSTAQTHIGTVVVNTKATDAHGIARDMRTELANNTVVSQSDTGMV